MWVEPYVIYKYRLEKPVTEFFTKYAGYLGVMAVVWGITEYCCRFISGQVFLGSDMQAGNLPDCAEYFIVAYLQENCRMEGIMEFAEKNCQEESLQEVKGDSFGKTAKKDFRDHTCV